MRTSNKRALTWALIAVGIAVVTLGAVMALTFPWSQVMAQAQAQAGAAPAFGPWHGYYGVHPGWGYFHGPRFFGGGLLGIVLVVLVLAFIVRAVARPWRYHRRYGPDERPDAEEILRREFAEGRITEEEFTRRRDALRK